MTSKRKPKINANILITHTVKCADRAFILQLGETMKSRKTIKKPIKKPAPAPRPTPPPKKTYYA